MRKLVYAAMGAAALASASTAGAAVMVQSATNLNDPNPMDAGSVVVDNGITTINFGQNPVTAPTFNGSFSFTNTAAGLYSLILGSSTTSLAFTTANLSGGGNSYDFTFLSPRQLSLDPISLAAATVYTLSFTGNSPNGGALTGNVTISPATAAVPEATTWAMMLLGFGAMGLAIRRRRRPVLAQLA